MPRHGKASPGYGAKGCKRPRESKMEKRGDLQVEPGRCQKSEPKVLKAQGRGERASGLVAETPTRLTHRNQSLELRRPRGERQDVGTACLRASPRPPAPQGGDPGSPETPWPRRVCSRLAGRGTSLPVLFPGPLGEPYCVPCALLGAQGHQTALT